MMVRVRPPAAAGVFYPADPTALLSEVRRLLEAVPAPGDAPLPLALIVPHAGYRYSGPVAAHAWARLQGRADAPHTVILLGPAHYARVAGVGASSATAFASPLGELVVQGDPTTRALGLACVRVRDDAHAPEHSLEVQLPFLQVALPHAAIVPLLAGEQAQDAVEAVLDCLWENEQTLVVVSSDLSHHLSYEGARARDRATAAAVEALDAEAITEGAACGRAPVQALLRVARRRGLCARMLDLRNSGDTAGPRGQVVGYGAFMLCAA